MKYSMTDPNPCCSLFMLFFCVILGVNGYAQSGENSISGIVTDVDGPKSLVNVSVKGTNYGIQTNEQGRYTIKASPKDILVFSHVGMKTEEIIVEDVTKVINIQMEPLVNALEEVVVSKRKRKTQESLAKDYFGDPTVIKTNHGYLSPALVGYELRTVDGKALNRKARDILDAIAEQLPGTVVRENPNGRVGRFLFEQSFGSLRGASSVAYEVDGVIFRDAPVWLDIRTVLRVALMPSSEAIYRYGAPGNGGMVIINTNNVKYGYRDRDGRVFDSARLRGNTYNNDAVDREMVAKNDATYAKRLRSSKDLQDALVVYNDNKMLYGDSYTFVLDVWSVVYHTFEGEKEAQELIADNSKLFDGNPVALKALAYQYEAAGMFHEAHGIYRDIYALRPMYAQSYRDLANSYRNIGKPKQGAAIYTRYQHLRDIGYLERDSTAFTALINREMNNMLALEDSHIFDSFKRDRFVLDEDFRGTRLVFEWNDGEAEFELQFVNPLGNFHTAVHTADFNPDRLREEKMIGFSCEEFLIDDSMKGDWLVNVKYLGNKRLSPIYLKVTVYFNYGSANQYKEVRTYKLALKGVNQQLFAVQSSGQLMAR